MSNSANVIAPASIDDTDIHIWNGELNRPRTIVDIFHLPGVVAGAAIARTGSQNIDYRADPSTIKISQFFKSKEEVSSFILFLQALPGKGLIQVKTWKDLTPIQAFVMNVSIDRSSKGSGFFRGTDYQYLLQATVVMEAITSP